MSPTISATRRSLALYGFIRIFQGSYIKARHLPDAIQRHLNHSSTPCVVIQTHCWSEQQPRHSRSMCSKIAQELPPLDDVPEMVNLTMSVA